MPTKVCNKCKQEKPLTEFHRHNRRGKEGYQNSCKPCAIAARVAYYKANTEKEKARNIQWTKKHIEWVRSLKEGKPCTDCGKVFHFAAMQWDHLPGREKLFTVGANREKAKTKILAETEKCELVCANCHAVRTYERNRE